MQKLLLKQCLLHTSLFQGEHFATAKDSPWVSCYLLKCVLSRLTLAQINKVSQRKFSTIIYMSLEKVMPQNLSVRKQ